MVTLHPNNPPRYGDVLPVTPAEFGYAVACVILGSGIYASIFSQFVAYTARLDAASLRYEEKTDDVRRQMQ